MSLSIGKNTLSLACFASNLYYVKINVWQKHLLMGGDNEAVLVFPLEFQVLLQPNGTFFDSLEFLLLVGLNFSHHNMSGDLDLGLVSYVFIPLCKIIVLFSHNSAI